jgi:predicted metal-binding membrane protein
VTQRRASSTGRRLWPVDALRTSAPLVLIVLLSFAAFTWLFMLHTSGDLMSSNLGLGMGQTDNMGMVGGGALLLAGGHQLTRYKTVCLRYRRTPLDFMLHWRSGRRLPVASRLRGVSPMPA